MTLRNTVDFLLYEWLHTEELQTRERFADHSRETFDAVLDTCERMAREKYAPFNRTVDIEEPVFDGEKVILPACTQEALNAYAASGMLSAAQDTMWAACSCLTPWKRQPMHFLRALQ
jgi:butyryl-CoA dehydrogenase